jgi:hypothetical protein
MNNRSRQYRIAGIVSLALLFCVSAATVFSGQTGTTAATDSTSVPDVKCVIGLDEFKPNTTGIITVQGDSVSFAKDKKKGEIKVTQISDIFLGNESRQDISGLGGTAVKAAIPYGGGRILSLFSHKVEVMTVEFKDANGGFHGAIFVLPEGHATALRNLLVAKGAKVTQHAEPPPPTENKQ